jgi:hypothetical protein
LRIGFWSLACVTWSARVAAQGDDDGSGVTRPAGLPWDDARIVSELGGSANGLHQYTFRRMSEDQIAWMDMNPFALFDLGYITRLDADLGEVWRQLVPLMLTTTGGGEPVTVYFRRREGRSKPLPPHAMRTHHSRDLTVTRLLQKGGFPTGNAGDHKDGLLDAKEAYTDLWYGELLHQLGMLSTRGLLAVKSRNVQRNAAGAAPAGILVRFNEFPRLAEPEGFQNNYMDRMLDAVRYDHPLIVSGLQELNVLQKNWFLALMNEAQLKDQWILHGSYLFEENRSASLIDFGTMAALWEPNPAVSLGHSSYGQELSESGEIASTAMGYPNRNVPAALRDVTIRGKKVFDQVFYSTFAFHQLRRLGLTDDQILASYTEETLPGSNFRFRLASDELLAVARAVTEIDKQVWHAGETFTADWSDGKSKRTNERVLVNTRKLWRNIATSGIAQSAAPTAAEIDALLTASFFGTHMAPGGDPAQILAMLKTDQGKYDYLVRMTRLIVAHCHDVFAAALRDPGVGTRAGYYATEQRIPSRDKVGRMAERWLADGGTFGREFKESIESLLPAGGPVQERRRAHLARPPQVPRQPPVAALRRLNLPCVNAERHPNPPHPVVAPGAAEGAPAAVGNP